MCFIKFNSNENRLYTGSSRSEFSVGYQHLFGSHEPTERSGPPFIQYNGRLNTSTVVLGELYAGAHMMRNPTRVLIGINDLLRDVNVIPFDDRCAEEFGKLRGVLHQQGMLLVL